MKYYQALKEYLSKNPKVAKSLRKEPLSSVSPSTLPRQYNDIEFDGDRIVDGTHCKTVGEYKAACAKFYDPV